MKQDFSGQRKDEKLLFVFRSHIFAMCKGFFVSIVLTIAGFVPYIISPGNINLLWLALIVMIFAAFVFLYHWIGWYFTLYIVTDQRVRQDRQKGLFHTSVVEISLEKIHNISVEKRGLLGSLFNYGTLVLQTYVGDLVIGMVSNAMEVREKLQKEISGHKTKLNKEPYEG